MATANDLFEVIGKGKVKIAVNQTYPLAEAARAHRDLEVKAYHGLDRAAAVSIGVPINRGNLRRFFPEARIVRVERPAYAPPIRATDLTSKVAVVWRKGSEKRLPKEAKNEFARIAGKVAVTPERVGRPLAALPAGIGRAKVDLGDRGRRSQAIRSPRILFLVIET